MITQEYIDGTPEITSLLVKLREIVGVKNALAKPIDNPKIGELAHAESVMFIVEIPKNTLKDTLYIELFNGNEIQQIGFAMPPEIYLNITEGHNRIVEVMQNKVNRYLATGELDWKP